MFPLLLGFLLSTVKCSSFRKGRDSYLDAYKESHGGSVEDEDTIIDRGSLPSGPSGFDDNGYPPNSFPGPVQNYGPPQQFYGPPNRFRPPQPVYGPPQGNYGPPQAVYGPPQPNYGPPQPNYGPPQVPLYGPPVNPPSAGFGHPPVHVHNYPPEVNFPKTWGLYGLWEKFKFKLDILTILKIFLKLALFKKFVAFMGIIFLLLFIPWIKNHKIYSVDNGNDNNNGGGGIDNMISDEMEDFRNLGYHPSDYYINNLTMYVHHALERFRTMDSDDFNCQSIYCRANEIIDQFYNKTRPNRVANNSVEDDQIIKKLR